MNPSSLIRSKATSQLITNAKRHQHSNFHPLTRTHVSSTKGKQDQYPVSHRSMDVRQTCGHHVAQEFLRLVQECVVTRFRDGEDAQIARGRRLRALTQRLQRPGCPLGVHPIVLPIYERHWYLQGWACASDPEPCITACIGSMSWTSDCLYYPDCASSDSWL